MHILWFNFQFVLLDKKSCGMLIYFNHPTQFRYLKYTELFKSYIIEKISQVENEDQDDLSDYFLINIPGLETLYLQSRSDRTKPSIIRMEILYVISGTKYKYFVHKKIIIIIF